VTVRERKLALRTHAAALQQPLVDQYLSIIAKLTKCGMREDHGQSWSRLWSDVASAYRRGLLSDNDNDRLLSAMP
jgi:hypothetical protein